MYKLELVNKKTKEVTIFDDIVDLNYGGKLFFNFEIDATQLADGEYALSLYENGELILTDTLCVGDFDIIGIQYKKGEAIYIETKLNAKTEEKTVEISNINTTILPDEGYDAITTLEVNAQPVYDGGYNVGNADGYESGYSRGKSDGFNEGKEEGYTEGKEDGISEQKAKLEGITITENGTYTKDDGYNNIVVEVPDLNGSYDEGYDAGYSEGVEEGTSNAGIIIAETAQVLNITENGVYATKYSKVEDFGREVTGYFDDGTPFYNYAKLNGKVFQTDALVTKDSKIELWWKPSWEWDNNSSGDGIFGVIRDSLDNTRITLYNGIRFDGAVSSYTSSSKTVELEDRWYHFVLSLNDGFVIDGEYIGTTKPMVDRTVPGYINISRYNSDYPHANGYFGMVKVDNNIYIPTENGFINQTTNTPLEVYQDGGYKFFGVPETESNLIRTVNVNVVPTINPIDYGVTFGNSTFTALPDIFKLPQRIESTKLEALFMDATKLTDISCFEGMTEIYLDTNMSTYKDVLQQTFQDCTSLADLTPLSNIRIVDDNFTNNNSTIRIRLNYTFHNTVVTDFSPLTHIFDNVTREYTLDVGAYAFASTALKRFELDWDWSKCTNYYQALGDNKNIEYIQELDATSVTNGYNPLDVLYVISGTTNLTYFGGYKNQKNSMNSNYFLTKCPNLTRESCLAIINNLYDFTGNGETPNSSQGKLKVHSNFLSLVGDEISIGTSKGWTITA